MNVLLMILVLRTVSVRMMLLALIVIVLMATSCLMMRPPVTSVGMTQERISLLVNHESVINV